MAERVTMTGMMVTVMGEGVMVMAGFGYDDGGGDDSVCCGGSLLSLLFHFVLFILRNFF